MLVPLGGYTVRRNSPVALGRPWNEALRAGGARTVRDCGQDLRAYEVHASDGRECFCARWFQDLAGVLKLSQPSRSGRRARVELRIPFSLAMRVYQERSR